MSASRLPGIEICFPFVRLVSCFAWAPSLSSSSSSLSLSSWSSSSSSSPFLQYPLFSNVLPHFFRIVCHIFFSLALLKLLLVRHGWFWGFVVFHLCFALSQPIETIATHCIFVYSLEKKETSPNEWHVFSTYTYTYTLTNCYATHDYIGFGTFIY